MNRARIVLLKPSAIARVEYSSVYSNQANDARPSECVVQREIDASFAGVMHARTSQI